MRERGDMDEAADDLRSEEAEVRARGVRKVQALESRGDPLAAYAIGTWLLAGTNGYPHDEAAAGPYLQYAADRGVTDAIYDLAVWIEKRSEGKRPRRSAFNGYLTAAILGDRDAAHEVVRCMHWGIGTFADPQAAERLHDALETGEQPLLAAE